MATYLKYHQLERSPFEGRGSDQLVLATASLRRAYAEIKSGLDDDSPRICITGGAGIGKSSLARALPKLLASDARCVLIRDPSLDWDRVKASIAKQLQLEDGQVSRSSLLGARREGRRLVLVIDNAEDLPSESLEHLDVLLGYRDHQGEQLVQCVLLANLEEAPRGGDLPILWWLDNLTTRQLRFAPIPEQGLRNYVDKHLAKAGWRGQSLFSDDAIVAIHRYTGGVPGAVSALCEELLARAARARKNHIDARLVASLCGDELPLLEEAPPAPEPEIDLPRLATPPRRAPAPPVRRPPPAPPREEEEEMLVHQGLLPVDEEETAPLETVSRDDYFERPRPSAASSPYTGAWSAQGFGPDHSRDGDRAARLMRQLTLLAVLACVAVGAHMWLNSGSAPDLLKHVPVKIPMVGKPTAAAEAPAPEVSVPPMVPPTDRDLASRSLALEESQGRDDSSATGGLTSDLKLDPAKKNAAVAPGAAVVPAPEPAAVQADPSLSLRDLYEIAEKAKEEQEAFEPWAEQGPQGEGAAPAAPAPRRP